MSKDILPEAIESTTDKNTYSDKENFLATVAHDFKTPINAEINALKLLLNNTFGDLGEEQKEIIKDILNSTRFLKDLVENILCKNKFDENKLTLLKQACSLKNLVIGCVESLSYILNPKGQKIVLKENNSDIKISIDILEMTRVINNLISNASQYAPLGSTIFVEIFEDKRCAGIAVTNLNSKISSENLEKVFCQYVSYSKEYKHLGTGLGLYISKKIVEAHNGTIKIENKDNKNIKVTIVLPK